MGGPDTPFGVRLASRGLRLGVAGHPWWLQILYIFKCIIEKTNAVETLKIHIVLGVSVFY